jgi:hypothetical protein
VAEGPPRSNPCHADDATALATGWRVATENACVYRRVRDLDGISPDLFDEYGLVRLAP